MASNDRTPTKAAYHGKPTATDNPPKLQTFFLALFIAARIPFLVTPPGVRRP
jgi:hypothetical protein